MVINNQYLHIASMPLFFARCHVSRVSITAHSHNKKTRGLHIARSYFQPAQQITNLRTALLRESVHVRN